MTKKTVNKEVNTRLPENDAENADVNPELNSRGNRQLRRQTLFFAILSAATLFIFIAVSLYNNVTAARYQQVDDFILSLINPPAAQLSELILNKDVEQIQQLVDSISTNEFVISCNVFNINGEIIASSSLDYKSKVKMRTTYVENTNVRFYLEPIQTNDKQIGFLQLQFAYKKMLNTFTIFKLDATKSISVLFILLVFLGLIISFMIKPLLRKFSRR